MRLAPEAGLMLFWRSRNAVDGAPFSIWRLRSHPCHVIITPEGRRLEKAVRNRWLKQFTRWCREKNEIVVLSAAKDLAVFRPNARSFAALRTTSNGICALRLEEKCYRWMAHSNASDACPFIN